MARATIPRNIEINKKIQENLPQTVADASQIHQVVLNLCINAFHAMEKQGGVWIFLCLHWKSVAVPKV